MLPIFIIVAVVIIMLCIPGIQAGLINVWAFRVRYLPSTLTLILIAVAIIALPAAIVWSIYGLVTLIVLSVLAVISIWSPKARVITTFILIVGVLVAFFYPPAKNFVVENYSSIPGWIETNKELTNIKIEESSLSMKSTIKKSPVTRGIFGKISEDTACYDYFGEMIKILKKGQPVKTMDGVRPQNPKTGDEGTENVVLPNKYGNFIFVGEPDVVRIPIGKVYWEKPKKEEVAKKELPPPQKTIASTSAKVEHPAPVFNQPAPVVQPVQQSNLDYSSYRNLQHTPDQGGIIFYNPGEEPLVKVEGVDYREYGKFYPERKSYP